MIGRTRTRSPSGGAVENYTRRARCRQVDLVLVVADTSVAVDGELVERRVDTGGFDGHSGAEGVAEVDDLLCVHAGPVTDVAGCRESVLSQAVFRRLTIDAAVAAVLREQHSD